MYRLFILLGGIIIVAGGILVYKVYKDDKSKHATGSDNPSVSTSVANSKSMPVPPKVTVRPKSGAAVFKTTVPRPVARLDLKTQAYNAILENQQGQGGFGQDRSDFDRDSEYEPNELIVVNAPSGFEDNARALGYTILERTRLEALSMTAYRLRTPSGSDMAQSANRLRRFFPGAFIAFNHRFDLSAERGAAVDASAKLNAVVSRTRAAIGWQDISQNCGTGVRIGMIDSSIDLRHPALADRKIEFRSFHNKKRKQGNAKHGTAVASILVGKLTGSGLGGVLPGAELKAVNMFEYTQTGKLVGNAFAMIVGLNWLVAKHVHAINLSVAGADNIVMGKALEKVEKTGVVVIAAAGNWGRDDRPAYPAAYSNVLAVTAVTAADGSTQEIYKWANTGKYIDFAAPGVRLYTAEAGGGGGYQSGTSFSAPFLTALAAIEVAAAAGKTNIDVIRTKFARASADLGKKGKDNVFGWGFIEKKPVCHS